MQLHEDLKTNEVMTQEFTKSKTKLGEAKHKIRELEAQVRSRSQQEAARHRKGVGPCLICALET